VSHCADASASVGGQLASEKLGTVKERVLTEIKCKLYMRYEGRPMNGLEYSRW